jgi:hypothetical protein
LGGATAAIVVASSGIQSLGLDTLGFTASNPEGHAVIVMDTEQSPFDAYTCYKRAMDRAGGGDDPKWLYHYALVGLSPEQLKKAMDEAIALAIKECGGIFILILDGCADFVNSVNDEAECNGLVNWLRERTVTHNCPAICVIHSNEGVKTGDDGRGHLGKQLTRKAESNLLLKKTKEITTITSEKQRKAPITEADGVAFKWSDEAQRHVTVKDHHQGTSKAGRPVKYDPMAMLGCFPSKDKPGMTVAAVHRIVRQLPCDISPRGFTDVVTKLIETGEVERLDGGALGFIFRRSF